MAFTTATVVTTERGRQQFQGLWDNIWKCVFTVNPSSIAAGAEDSSTFTVPGVALGDAVIAVAPGVDLTIDAEVSAYVSAANTVTIRISNLNASTALDLGSSTWKLVVARPNF